MSHNSARMPATSESESMSDNSDMSYCGDDKSDMKGDDICRDYLRNVCKRGKRCKYRHPNPTEAKDLGRKHEYTFCHDFQNSGCRRPNCRFLHCTRDEEDYYKQTGQLPVRLQQAAAIGIGVLPNELPLLRGEVPVCKDFLKGQCMRAGRCKYRHTNPPNYEPTPDTKERSANGSTETFETLYSEDSDRYTCDYDSSPALALTVVTAKRRRTEEVLSPYVGYQRSAHTPVDQWLLEENTMLRRKLEEFKKQVSDLAATNEVLLEQNARYRSTKLTNVTTVPPVVTVTQVLTPTITPAPAMARPHIPHHPQTLGTLTTPAQITVNGTLGPLATPTQLPIAVNGTLGPLTNPTQITVNANSELVVSQPTLPTINTPVSMTINHPPQNIVPVSITAHVAPPGSLTTVSLPQNIGLPQPPGVTLPQTTLQNGQTMMASSLSRAMVSYPIMSHCVTQLTNGGMSSLG